MGPAASTEKALTPVLAKKWSINYSLCLFWIRCRLHFSLLWSDVMHLRASVYGSHVMS